MSEGTRKYKVHTSINVEGTEYIDGQEVELTPEEAAAQPEGSIEEIEG